LLAVFFLVPLGLAACLRGRPAAWRGFFFAVLLNVLCILGISFFTGRAFAEFLPDLGFFFLSALVFSWLMAPPSGGAGLFRIFSVRAAYRLILGALGLAGIWFVFGDSAGFGTLVRSQAELLSSLAVDSAGGDAVRRSLLEQELNPRRIEAVFNMVLARGGILASSMIVLFISRQLSLAVAGLAGGRGSRSLGDFHVPPFFIWVLSISLGGILLFRLAGLSLPETAVWNLLTVCALMYLAQGFAIVRFFLSRRELPAFARFFMNLGIVLAILSPGINMAALGLLALLGIAECWIPLRREIRNDRPPPTPAA
jgi:hypothetical protein